MPGGAAAASAFHPQLISHYGPLRPAWRCGARTHPVRRVTREAPSPPELARNSRPRSLSGAFSCPPGGGAARGPGRSATRTARETLHPIRRRNVEKKLIATCARHPAAASDGAAGAHARDLAARPEQRDCSASPRRPEPPHARPRMFNAGSLPGRTAAAGARREQPADGRGDRRPPARRHRRARYPDVGDQHAAALFDPDAEAQRGRGNPRALCSAGAAAKPGSSAMRRTTTSRCGSADSPTWPDHRHADRGRAPTR